MTVYYTVLRRADNTRTEKDKQRQRAFSFLLKKLNADPHQDIKKEENGRPYLPFSPTIDISLSHADLFTVYAAGDTRLGIDIESPADIHDPAGLCRRFFVGGEKDYAEHAENLSAAVCEIWTKKEALAKFLGDGLSKNLHLDTTKWKKDFVFNSKFSTFNKKPYIITICAHRDARITFLDPKCFKF